VRLMRNLAVSTKEGCEKTNCVPYEDNILLDVRLKRGVKTVNGPHIRALDAP
jgi:hypothetical protein